MSVVRDICPAMRVAQRIVETEASGRAHTRTVEQFRAEGPDQYKATFYRYAARDALQEADMRRRELAHVRALSLEGAEAQVLELVERMSALFQISAEGMHDQAEDDYRLGLRLAFSILGALEEQSGRSSQEVFGRSFGSHNMNPWLDPAEAIALIPED